jgi:hypothetical protein
LAIARESLRSPSAKLTNPMVQIGHGSESKRASRVVAEGIFYALPVELVPAVNALGVNAQQNIDTVPGPFGDLGWVYAGIEPCGKAGVA